MKNENKSLQNRLFFGALPWEMFCVICENRAFFSSFPLVYRRFAFQKLLARTSPALPCLLLNFLSVDHSLFSNTPSLICGFSYAPFRALGLRTLRIRLPVFLYDIFLYCLFCTSLFLRTYLLPLILWIINEGRGGRGAVLLRNCEFCDFFNFFRERSSNLYENMI